MRDFRPGDPGELYGIAAERIAEICGVHVTTARRWKRGESPPKTALELVRLAVHGDLGVIDPKWSGWKLVGGDLVAPEGTRFQPGEVMAGPYWRTLARAYQTQQRLPHQADWIEGQWTVNAYEEVASG